LGELLLQLREKASNDPAVAKAVLYSINAGVLKALRAANCLAVEFCVAMSPARMYHGESDSTMILSSYLRYLTMQKDKHIWGNASATVHQSEEKRVSSHDAGITSKTFKLAEVLGLSRLQLKSLAAREAAAAGEARQALLICREIQEKALDQLTSSALIDVTRHLSEQDLIGRATKKQLKNAEEGLTRLPGQLLLLSQKSLTSCDSDHLGEFLDTYKHMELQNTVFSQTDSGDYSQGTNGAGDNSADMDTAWEQQDKGKGKGKGKSVAPTPVAKPREEQQRRVASVTKTPFFYENGLVLDTCETMKMVSAFVASSLAMTRSDKTVVKLSKGKTASEDPAAQLISYLHSNGTFQTALRLFKLSEEVRVRYPRSLAPELPISLFDTVLETLGAKVLGDKDVDNSLSFAYMVALPIQKSFVAFKSGLSTVGSNFYRLVQFASIGMSSALLWKQSTFLVDCKKLKKNAVWWHQLSLLGIPFDENAFRNSNNGDYQRTLVTPLLKGTCMDITTALEFGRAYLIEGLFVFLFFFFFFFFF